MTAKASERHAWKVLLVLIAIFALFGIGDIIAGTAADPAITEGVTGMTPEELEAASPEGFRLADALTRANGAAIFIISLLAAAIVWGPFRRGDKWAWYTLLLLPVWMVLIFALTFLATDPATGVIPPPVLSAPIFLLLFIGALFWPFRQFFPKDVAPQPEAVA
jgi:hypothetical protein